MLPGWRKDYFAVIQGPHLYVFLSQGSEGFHLAADEKQDCIIICRKYIQPRPIHGTLHFHSDYTGQNSVTRSYLTVRQAEIFSLVVYPRGKGFRHSPIWNTNKEIFLNTLICHHIVGLFDCNWLQLISSHYLCLCNVILWLFPLRGEYMQIFLGQLNVMQVATCHSEPILQNAWHDSAYSFRNLPSYHEMESKLACQVMRENLQRRNKVPQPIAS